MRRKVTKIQCPGPRLPESKRRQGGLQKVYLRTKNSRLRAFLFIACCLLMVSCFDKGDCLFVNTDVVKVNLVDKANPKVAKKILFSSVSPSNMVLFPNPDSVSTVYLVVDPTKTAMTYTLEWSGRTDNITLDYTNQTIVLSPDCGSYVFQDNLTVESTTFDSVRVVNQRLLTNVSVNLEILH